MDCRVPGIASARARLTQQMNAGQNREFSFSEPVATLGRARGRPIVLIKEWRDVQAELVCLRVEQAFLMFSLKSLPGILRPACGAAVALACMTAFP
eukprot:1157722-Pelagomonas_calceolata.AAC.1